MAGIAQIAPTCGHNHSTNLKDGTSCLAPNHPPAPAGTQRDPAPAHKAILTYYIFEGFLVGQLDGRLIQIPASSGGGGASTSKKDPAKSQTVNNPHSTGQKEIPGKTKKAPPILPGGPIPVGTYIIDPPTPWGEGIAARLQPLPSAADFSKRTGGDSLLIYHSGPLASSGCIVPPLQSDFYKLMHGLKLDGGGQLTVLESMKSARSA